MGTAVNSVKRCCTTRDNEQKFEQEQEGVQNFMMELETPRKKLENQLDQMYK